MDNMASSTSDNGQYFNLTQNNTAVTNQSDSFGSIPYLITTLTICVLGTVLNSLVIIVIVYGSLMRTSVFMILLLVLAVFDNVILCSYVLIQDKMYGLLPLSSSLWLCHIFFFGFYTAANVSSWLIVLISAECTIAVFWPLQMHIYCMKRKPIFTISMLPIEEEY